MADVSSMRDLVAELEARLARVRLGGPSRAREAHRERGKLFARDRIDALLDPGSPFLEFSALAAYGMYSEDDAYAVLQPVS